MKIFAFLIIIICVFNKANAQHLIVKANVLNPIFSYPNVDVEYQINNTCSISLHTSFGKSFFVKRDFEPYYKFSTVSLDYFYSYHNSKNGMFQMRTLIYFGLIQRKIFQDEVYLNYLNVSNRKGRNFTGNAIRTGVGLSFVNKLSNKFSLENNFGMGYGRYYFTKDDYYLKYERAYNGYIDFRYALNLCYKLF